MAVTKVALVVGLVLCGQGASASLGRLSRPRVYFVDAPHPYPAVKLPGVDLSALAKAEQLRSLRAERSRALAALGRWSDELEVEPPSYWQGLDRFLPAARLRGFQAVRQKGRVRERAELQRHERETMGRFDASIKRLERECEAALRALKSRLASLRDRASAPAPILYLLARVSLELGAVESGAKVSAEDAAIADLERLLLAAPDVPLARDARLTLGELLRARGRPEDALSAIHPLLCQAENPERDAYRRCAAPAKADSLLERGWFLAGEIQLVSEPARAAAAYRLALGSGSVGSSRRAPALYQSGLAHHRLDQSELAARQLDRLLSERGGGVALRAASLELLVVVYGDFAWEGRMEPTTPGVSLRVERKDGKKVYRLEHQGAGITAEEALANLARRYRGRQQPWVHDLYRRVAELYCGSGRLAGCETIARQVLKRWPHHAAAAGTLDLLIGSLERRRLIEQAEATLQAELSRFAPGSAWWRGNQQSATARRGLRALTDRLRRSVLGQLSRAQAEPAQGSAHLCRAIALTRANLSLLPRAAVADALRDTRCVESQAPPSEEDRLLAGRISRWVGAVRPTPTAAGPSPNAGHATAEALAHLAQPPWVLCRVSRALPPSSELNLRLRFDAEGRVLALALRPRAWESSELGRCLGGAMRKLQVRLDEIETEAELTVIWL